MSLTFQAFSSSRRENPQMHFVHKCQGFQEMKLDLSTTLKEKSESSNIDSPVNNLFLSLKNSHHNNSSFENLDTISTNSSESPAEDHEIILNSTLKQKKHGTTNESKYKTEFCRNWSEIGQCPYGKKCKFAHGKNELHEKPVSPRIGYKSKRCSSFHNKLLCMYGVRCLFSHDQRSLRELLDKNYYRKFITHPELLQSSLLKQKTRLPFFRSNAEERNSRDVDYCLYIKEKESPEKEFNYYLSCFNSKNYFLFGIGSQTLI